jgi:hypothetical protein
VVGNGALEELSKRYEDLVRGYGLEHWGPEDLDFDALITNLRAAGRVAVCPGCRKDGGRDDCELRACATGRNLESCTECPEFGSCEHEEKLRHMRDGAVKAGLFVDDGGVDRERLLEEWTSRLKTAWPCCLLFSGGR